jgi:hypothetical protein
VFNEAYCHSAGAASGTNTYEIKAGTTEIIFKFERFDQFLHTYLLGNPHLPTEIKNSIREKKGIFCAQLLQNGLYLCTEAVSPDGHISLRSQSLKPLGHHKRLREFSNGTIAFGIFRPDASAFDVLWATMYKAVRS